MITTNGNGTKRRLNGSKRRLNGSKLRERHSYQKSNTYVTDDGVTVGGKKPKSRSKYFGEMLVGYMALGLMMAAGIRLAIQAGYGDSVMIAGQVIGFCASTVFIAILKHKLSKGLYTGLQRRVGMSLFYSGVLLEGLTLAAKFFPVIIPGYLFTVVFTIPGLVIASFNIAYLDEDKRLKTLRKENVDLRERIKEEERLLSVKSELSNRLTDLRSQEKIDDKKRDERLRLATKSKGRIKRVATAENERYLIVLEDNAGIKRRRWGRRKAAKQITTGETTPKKTRSTKGPRPENATNGIYCKARGCDDKLPEGKKKYCSDECGNRERQRRLREKNKSNS